MQRIINFFNKHSILIVIFLAGAGLRFYNLTKISLWHDEAFSALLIKYNWGEMIYRIGLDVHPPMYYFFLRVWHYIFGYSLFSLRSMSVAFGLATIIAVYVLVKRFFGTTQAALIAASLVAFNPFQVQYVTEARMYTMGAFFAVLAAYYLALALQATKNYYTQNNPILKPSFLKVSSYYLGFVITASILTYTHYYLLFTVAGLGLSGLVYLFIQFRFSIKKYLWLVLSGIGIGVLFIPWLKIFLFQFKQVGAGYWIPPMNIWSIPSTLYDLLLRINNPPSKFMMILCSLLTLMLIWQLIKQYQQTEKWLILIPFLAPFGGAILFAILAKIQGQDSSVYLVRYFLFASPFFLIMLGLWLHRIKINGLKWLFLFALLAINCFTVFHYWQQLDVNNKPGMASLAKLVNTNLEQNHKLFVASSFEFFNLKYYNQSFARPLLYTNNHHVKDLPHFAGTAILTEEDLVLNFKDATTSGDTVWMVWTNGFGGSKPVVPTNWTQIDEHGFAEVRPYVGTWVVVTEYKVN
jgi:mannosyltransferase